VTDGLTLGAALLLGFAASGHCLVMCGGISAALGVATAKRADGKPRTSILIAYQVGRMFSYAMVGGTLGGVLGFIVGWLDEDAVRQGLRAMSVVALVAAALVVFGVLRDPGSRLGRIAWPRLAALGRRLLPVTNIRRAIGFGMVWGWMPCGFAYTVMVIAALEHDAVRSAATMLAFGIGTGPAMIAVALGARRAASFAAGSTGKRIAGAVLLASAALTLFAPQIVAAAPWLHPWMPYLCRVDAS
jgi:uncharacterized protein